MWNRISLSRHMDDDEIEFVPAESRRITQPALSSFAREAAARLGGGDAAPVENKPAAAAPEAPNALGRGGGAGARGRGRGGNYMALREALVEVEFFGDMPTEAPAKEKAAAVAPPRSNAGEYLRAQKAAMLAAATAPAVTAPTAPAPVMPKGKPPSWSCAFSPYPTKK